jgi:ATP phosphoribosyltransferase
MLKIAVQKSGRLLEESILILRECGIHVPHGDGRLKTEANGFPLEIYFLRNSDIPSYLKDGVVDLAILGTNMLAEYGNGLCNILPLGFSKCRLSLATLRDSNTQSVSDLNGKRIATSYPISLGEYLNKNNIQAQIHEISGSVEIAPTIGLADAICDLVSSGSTLIKNGLIEMEVILQSEAALIGRSNYKSETNAPWIEKLVFRLQSVLASKNSKYILLNTPNESIGNICRILPGMKSPTILPLAQPGWSSLHSVIDEQKFWDIIDELKSAGAEGILVIPIEKMIL